MSAAQTVTCDLCRKDFPADEAALWKIKPSMFPADQYGFPGEYAPLGMPRRIAHLFGIDPNTNPAYQTKTFTICPECVARRKQQELRSYLIWGPFVVLLFGVLAVVIWHVLNS